MLTLLLRVKGQSNSSRDVSVEVEDQHTIADLAQALSMHLGDPLPAGHVPQMTCDRIGRLAHDSSVVSIGLLSGDEVTLSLTLPADSGLRPSLSGGLMLEVIGGPQTGTSVPLRAGSVRVGRSQDMQVAFEDPTVSSHHATLYVGSSLGVEIEPGPAVTNPLVVDGEAIYGRLVLPHGSVVQLGSSAFTVRYLRPENIVVRDQLGQIPFNRTPYRRYEVGEPKVDGPGRLPAKFERRPLQIIAMAMPAMSGLVMWATMPNGGARFLAITLLSPVIGVATWWDERRRGGKNYELELREFQARRDQWLERFDAAIERERQTRNLAAPDLASVVRRSKIRSTDLWQRHLAAPDFLSVRVGLGDVQTATTTDLPNGDDGSLINELEDARRVREVLSGVPIVLHLVTHPVIAVHGPAQAVEKVVAAVGLQIVGLHSPEDVIVAAALHPDRSLNSWLKWLPHTRSVSSPLSGEHIVQGKKAAEDLIRRLLEVGSGRGENALTRVVLLLDERCEADNVLVAALLSSAEQMKFSVVWIGDSLQMVPRQASAVIECPDGTSGERGTLWFTDPSIDTCRVDLDQMNEQTALEFARSLAPVTDTTSASATSSIPRVAPLFTTLGVLEATPEWIADNWTRNSRTYGLRAPVGIGASGQFSIDLVQNGPHGLVAGTSGAGKSEFLQSLVASLASQYPPERLNFLFIDYKGGASSNMFKDIPHTVGYVTNLSPSLSLRALTSLRAELNRRMRVLEGRAKDLEEMLEKHPADCPPSLVIVVDEFATLVKEIPDFVTGMVDVAQRGRSLGIHLILATQRPTGAVNDNILANTNLRISLRVLDSGDSQAIIGTSDAAFLPAPLRGRAFARTGAGQLTEFQSAFAGAPFAAADGVSVITVEDFPVSGTATQWPPRTDPATSGEATAQLSVLLAAIERTSRALHKAPGRAPWLEALPDLIHVDDVRDGSCGPVAEHVQQRDIVLGVVDEPESQRQYPLVINLESSGGLLFFGTGASGKTSALRTVMSGFVHGAGLDQAQVYVLDFGGRTLESVRDVGHVAAVATGDDLEQATRIIQHLQEEVSRRQAVLSEAAAENLSAYESKVGHGQLPRILLLLDGIETFARVFDRSDLYSWSEALTELILAGRSVGVHFVGTADRRMSVPAVVANAVDTKIALRMADADGLVDIGIPPAIARSADLGPGAGLLMSGHMVQIALVSADPAGEAQTTALIAGLSSSRGTPHRLTQLPALVRLGELAADHLSNRQFILGVEDLTLRTVRGDIGNSGLLIVGHPESGRSTAISLIGHQLAMSGERLHIISDLESPLANLTAVALATSKLDHSLVVNAVEADAAQRNVPILLIDCAGGLDDSAGYQLESLMAENRVRVVATAGYGSVLGYAGGWLGEVKRSRRRLILQPDDDSTVLDLAGVRFRWRPGMRFPPGRGVFVDGRRAVLIHVASP